MDVQGFKSGQKPGATKTASRAHSMLRLEWSAKARLAFMVLLSLLMTWGVREFPFLGLEAGLYDLRIRLYSGVASWLGSGLRLPSSPGVTVIAIDAYSARTVDDFLPMSSSHQADVIERIAQERPRAIGVILGQEGTALDSAGSSEPLERSLRRAMANGTPVLLGTGFDVMGERVPDSPLSMLPHAVAILHKDGNVFAEDKVTRRSLVQLYGRPTFPTRLAEMAFISDETSANRKGARRLQHLIDHRSYALPQIQAEYVFFGYRGNPAISGGRTEPGRNAETNPSFRWHSAGELLSGRVPPEALQDRVVLIGSVNPEDSRDFAATPFSRAPFETPRLALHAQIVASLLAGDVIQPVSAEVETLLIWLVTMGTLLLVSGAGSLLVPTSSPVRPWGVFAPGVGAPGPSLVATLLLIAAFALLNALVFVLARFWIPASSPMIAALLSTYLVLPFRLMSEHRARWEIEKKNSVLRQVDELKRNFLSLVTHDLKTPIARIQGLAETLQRRQGRTPERRSSETETPELVENMLDATEELNRFVTAILDLNRIDSEPPSLRIESKDVNRVIEEVIRRHDPIAERRGIRIHTELEPLFPIRIDLELVSKVLSNLIDNAIKYSGDGKLVTVRSSEISGRVRISVEDSGIGMSEAETGKLFTRFFRAKNDRTVGIHGTGLGLHLARYFVELHEGGISVESRPGAGSRFIIELPIDGPAGPKQRREKPTSGLTRILMRDASAEKSLNADKSKDRNEDRSHA